VNGCTDTTNIPLSIVVFWNAPFSSSAAVRAKLHFRTSVSC
jgi:hypothetical protein